MKIEIDLPDSVFEVLKEEAFDWYLIQITIDELKANPKVLAWLAESVVGEYTRNSKSLWDEMCDDGDWGMEEISKMGYKANIEE